VPPGRRRGQWVAIIGPQAGPDPAAAKVTWRRRSGLDGQVPHTEDEIYVVTAGRARLQAGGDSTAVGPGSVLYVPAVEAHRFTDVTEDFAAIVVFAPAEDSRAGRGA
jgi:mannose-6-phosphate isomerase-like protein (cupin superfamily)